MHQGKPATASRCRHLLTVAARLASPFGRQTAAWTLTLTPSLVTQLPLISARCRVGIVSGAVSHDPESDQIAAYLDWYFDRNPVHANALGALGYSHRLGDSRTGGRAVAGAVRG